MKWVMKNGKKIDIKDMTTSHIKNCIKMMDKKVGYEQAFGCIHDIDSFDVDFITYEDTPMYRAMMKELLLRIK